MRVGTDEQVREFRRVAGEVFGKDYTFTADELARGLAAGSTHHLGYIAYAGDEPGGRRPALHAPGQPAFGGLYGG